MIRDLDASLKAMIAGEARPGSELANATISFAVPDTAWRGQGSGLQLNAYLYRAIDNRELRSNARRLVPNPDGTVTQQLFPARVECSYIISAWNKAADVAGLEKEEQEHRLLSQVLYVLWRNPTMPPQYLTGLLANAEIALPLQTAESEDMAAKPDFWSTLETYVRPAITCRVTIALDLSLDVTGPQATTIETGFGANEQLFIIAGTIRNSTSPAATIANAWIRLDNSLRTYQSAPDGAFSITGITPGAHSLTVRAVGFQEAVRQFQVPELSAVYDVELIPL